MEIGNIWSEMIPTRWAEGQTFGSLLTVNALKCPDLIGLKRSLSAQTSLCGLHTSEANYLDSVSEPIYPSMPRTKFNNEEVLL